MAMTANDIIVITDVVNYINSYLKMSIQNQIKWYKEKLPPNFDSSLSHYFSSGKTLPDMQTPACKGSQIDIQKLYNSISSAFVMWSLVRRVEFHYWNAGWNNGGSIPWREHIYTGYGYLSFLNPGMVSAIMNHDSNNYRGVIISPLTMKNICDNLYAKWEQWSSIFQAAPSRRVCHSNCHGSCHGSGGRR